MVVKATVSFCGKETMRQGEVKDILDPLVAADLLKAGYVEEVKKKPARKEKGNG